MKRHIYRSTYLSPVGTPEPFEVTPRIKKKKVFVFEHITNVINSVTYGMRGAYTREKYYKFKYVFLSSTYTLF